MTKAGTPPTPKDATMKSVLREVLTDLLDNGYIDLVSGQIESKCDPNLLRLLLNFAREGQDVALTRSKG